jgi:carboxyl-terminal processing protease
MKKIFGLTLLTLIMNTLLLADTNNIDKQHMSVKEKIQHSKKVTEYINKELHRFANSFKEKELFTNSFKEKYLKKIKEEEKAQESLKKLIKTIAVVNRLYVDKLTMDEIINKTISGLMEQLDSHSNFMNTKETKDFKEKTNGEFVGLGIVVTLKDGVVFVISPIDDTPAEKTGIKAGDMILKINGVSTYGKKLEESIKLMKGKPGTSVTISILRKGSKKLIKKTIVRDKIIVKSVKSMFFDNILYLRISSFDKNVHKLLEKEINKYKDIKGVVLDLRNNPGGLLSQAIKTVDLFIEDGLIIEQRGRKKTKTIKTYAHKKTLLSNIPTIILINEGSASASEIVSGALQDHKRAVLVGQKTFGKGSVQTIIPISKKNETLKMTIARYYLPSGRTIQAVGVTPDIISVNGVPISKDDSKIVIKESDLSKHLKSELKKIKQTEVKEPENKFESKLKDDNQLKTGFNILKSIILFNN